MRQTLILLLIQCCLIMAQSNSSEMQLTLIEAIDLAQKQGYQLQVSQAKLDASEANAIKAWQELLPSVHLSTGYLKTTDPVAVFGGKLRRNVFSAQDFELPGLNNPDEFEHYQAAVHLQLPVFNIAGVMNKLAANRQATAGQFRHARTKQLVKFRVTASYYALLLAEESLKAVVEAVRSTLAHRDNAKLAFDQGIVSRADYLASEVRLAELREQEIMADNQTLDAEDRLKLLLGITDRQIGLALIDTMPLPLGKDEFKLNEVNERADILAASNQLSSLSLMRASGWMRYLPNVHFFCQSIHSLQSISGE